MRDTAEGGTTTPADTSTTARDTAEGGTTTPADTSTTDTGVLRLGGANRYETMGRLTEEGFASSDWAILATGEDFPYALAASALAGRLECPILLTPQGSLGAQAASQLSRLGVTRAVVMGGETSVSSAAQSQAEALGVETVRVDGATLTDMSLAAMRLLADSGTSVTTVVLSTPRVFADSLSVGPWCYATCAPVVFTDASGNLPATAASAIASLGTVTDIVIVGGIASVSDSVVSALGPSYTYTRLGGADRYQTSTLVSNWATERGLSWSLPALATGATYPDALAGAALQGAKRCPLLLCSPTGAEAATEIASHLSEVAVLTILGGEASVPSPVASCVARGEAAR